MLVRIARWFRDRAQWARHHKAAWDGMLTPEANGLSRFQAACESALTATLATRQRTLIERSIGGSATEPYVTARVSDSLLTVWIYLDQANVEGPGLDARYEQWDARTPQELIDQFCARVVRQLELASPAV